MYVRGGGGGPVNNLGDLAGGVKLSCSIEYRCLYTVRVVG